MPAKPTDLPEGEFEPAQVWIVLSTRAPDQREPRVSRVSARTSAEARKAVLREYPMSRVYSVHREEEGDDWAEDY